MRFYTKLISNLLFLSFLLFSPLKSISDDFTKGYKISDTFYLGGYLSTEYEKSDEKEAFLVDDLAFLLYGEDDRWDFVSEFEAKDIYINQNTPMKVEDSNLNFKIERINLTYYIDNYQTIKIGKFNSPIGFWNIMPINVLRDTTSSPYIVENSFPKLTSGICYRFALNENFDFLYITLQNNEDIDSSYNNFKIKKHYGITLEFEKKNGIFKVSGGYFRQRDNKESIYSVFAFKKIEQNYTLTIESSIKKIDSSNLIPYDVYLQNVWNLSEHYYLITRFEKYKTHEEDILTDSENIEENIWTFGLTYRPYPNVAIKGEYNRYSIQKSDKWLFSFSFMF
ncbi:hypothetical protein [Nitrosophilus labii]|uniref:hypothetical protein n=1 Tax=Nitrosophilus labii TaxID=2706014 RepID=UPI001656D700|nr:hypothetical protein [Nitrosophilus labii]